MTGVAENQVNVKFSFKNSCSELSIYFIYISLFIVYFWFLHRASIIFNQLVERVNTIHFILNETTASIQYVVENWNLDYTESSNQGTEYPMKVDLLFQITQQQGNDATRVKSRLWPHLLYSTSQIYWRREITQRVRTL